jgi:hypothetical protein
MFEFMNIPIWNIFNQSYFSLRSMIYFETGLHDFFIDAGLTHLVQVAARVLDLCYEINGECTKFIDSMLHHEAQSVWSELNFNHLESAFSLFGYSIIICLLILLFETMFFFMMTLFLVS